MSGQAKWLQAPRTHCPAAGMERRGGRVSVPHLVASVGQSSLETELQGNPQATLHSSGQFLATPSSLLAGQGLATLDPGASPPLLLLCSLLSFCDGQMLSVQLPKDQDHPRPGRAGVTRPPLPAPPSVLGHWSCDGPRRGCGHRALAQHRPYPSHAGPFPVLEAGPL